MLETCLSYREILWLKPRQTLMLRPTDLKKIWDGEFTQPRPLLSLFIFKTRDVSLQSYDSYEFCIPL